MLSCETVFLGAMVIFGAVTRAAGTVVKPRVYEIQNVNSSCTSQELKIRLELNRRFQGLVYAKGFPLEKTCRTYGSGETFVDITIDTSECGVRLVSTNDETLTYRITLSVQMDKFLQQITDLEVSTTCNLPTSMMHPKQVTRHASRTGRNKVSDVSAQVPNDVLTWMEIEGTSELSNINKVYVGEQTMMLVKSFLPENVDASVVDCYAYDGTRDVVQKLLDENGCPLDEAIMPSLEKIKFDEEEGEEEEKEEAEEENTNTNDDFPFSESNKQTERNKKKHKKTDWKIKRSEKGRANREDTDAGKPAEKTRLRVMGTMFSAFKFPDTSNLHLRCSLQLCRNACPPASCDLVQEASSNDRLGKSVKSDKNSTTVIERIEVFNSVEVLAPGIDVDGYSSNQDVDDPASNLDEKSFCLSTSKMAISFAILGAVFLCGVLAVLWTIMRNHMRKTNKIDGSEQILVVRDSPLNFRNVRNKMHQNWSYS